MEARKDASHFLERYRSWRRRTRIAAGLRGGILAPYWDELAAFLVRRGHTWYSARRVIEIAKPFAAHAEAVGVTNASELNEALVDRYLKVRQLRESRSCLHRLMLFLCEQGIVKDTKGEIPATKLTSPIVSEYRHFLEDHRGIGRKSSGQHQRYVESLLEVLGKDDFQSLTGAEVQRFITDRAKGLSRAQRKMLCASIRSFLRFLYLRGYTPIDLRSAVPVIPSFKLERLPVAVSPETIEKILAAVDRSSPVGRRDYAMLLSIATYGMRGPALRSSP